MSTIEIEAPQLPEGWKAVRIARADAMKLGEYVLTHVDPWMWADHDAECSKNLRKLYLVVERVEPPITGYGCDGCDSHCRVSARHGLVRAPDYCTYTGCLASSDEDCNWQPVREDTQ